MPDIDHHKATGGRRSWLGYMRILRTIHDGASSTKAIAEANGMRSEHMRLVLRRMLSLKLVHISGTETVSANHLQTPLWALGIGKRSIVLPKNRPLPPNIELVAVSYMLRALRRGPQTVASLAHEAGVHRNRAEEFARACRDELHMLYVAGYQKSARLKGGGSRALLWALGFDQPDVPKPEPMSPKVVWTRANQRVSARRRQRQALLAISANASIFTIAA